MLCFLAIVEVICCFSSLCAGHWNLGRTWIHFFWRSGHEDL